ncbi:hypothetical protein ACP70R_017552 [Stipagrostis hirtigluma subsp. patula]
MDARCGALAVAAATAVVRRPLQPRETNVAPSTVVVGKATELKTKLSKGEEKPRVLAVAVETAKVSLAEVLEKARERRGRLRASRERMECELEERAAALDREAAEWERRADEQRRFVAELMRLIGMPERCKFESEVYTPVESLRSREERKCREDIVRNFILHILQLLNIRLVAPNEYQKLSYFASFLRVRYKGRYNATHQLSRMLSHATPCRIFGDVEERELVETMRSLFREATAS